MIYRVILFAALFLTLTTLRSNATMFIVVNSSQNAEDSYVNADHPSYRYGQSEELHVGGFYSGKYAKRVYIRYTIPQTIPLSSIIRAEFHIYVLQCPTCPISPLSIALHEVYSNASWNEYEITWDDQPCGTQQGNLGITGGCNASQLTASVCNEKNWCVFDITPLVKKDYVVNFVLVRQGEVDERWIVFCSRECVNSSLRHYVILTLEEPTSTTPITTSTTTSSLPIVTTSTLPSTTTLPKIGNRPLLMVNSNFYDVLAASVLPFPVLVYNYSNRFATQMFQDFITSYSPSSIIGINVNYYDVDLEIDRSDLYRLFPRNGFVVIDEKNRSIAIYAAFLAKYLEYGLLNSSQIEEFAPFEASIICTYDCNIPNATKLLSETQLLNYLLDRLRSLNFTVKEISLVNSARDYAALAPRRNSIPIVFYLPKDERNPNSYRGVSLEEVNEENGISRARERIAELINSLRDERIFDKSYLFDETFYLTIFGMPFGVVEDPLNETLANLDGDVLFTDDLYGDVNNDGFIDLAIGRFCCSPELVSLQLSNVENWKGTKSVGIYASYRSAEGQEFLAPQGSMMSGLLSELHFRLAGFEVKRFVERRTKHLNLSCDFSLFERLLELLRNPLHSLEVLSIGYRTIVETDWLSLTSVCPPTPLPELSIPAMLSGFQAHGMNLYFGLGNETHVYWVNFSVDASELMRKSSIVIFDHPLSVYPLTSKFVELNPFLLIGSSGITHDYFALLPLKNFLRCLPSSRSVGSCLKEIKFYSLSSREKLEGLAGIISDIFLGEKSLAAKKEGIERLLFGDPSLKVDPIFLSLENLTPTFENNSFLLWFELNFTPSYVCITNDDVHYCDFVFPDPDFYLEREGRPPVPVFVREFVLPTGSELLELNVVHHLTKREVNPMIVDYPFFEEEESFVIYPERNVYLSRVLLLDNRSLVRMFLIPISYTNVSNSIVATVYNFTILLRYSAPVEIERVEVQEEALLFRPVRITVKGRGNCEGELIVKVENNEKTEELRRSIVVEGSWEEIFYFNPSREGLHKIIAVLDCGTRFVGPREASFFVRLLQPLALSPPSKSVHMFGRDFVELSYSSPFYGITCRMENDSTTYILVTPEYKLDLVLGTTFTSEHLSTPEIVYFVFTNSSTTIERLTTPFGSLRKEKLLGNVEIEIKGNGTKLELELEQAKRLLLLAREKTKALAAMLCNLPSRELHISWP